MPTTIFATPVLLLDGLLAGMFIGSSMVEHAAQRLTAPQWIAYKHAKERVFAPIMPIAFNFGLLVTIASAVLLPEHLILALAALLLAAVLAITVRVHLPLNSLFQAWAPNDYPVTWDNGRRRWRDWNLLRTGLVVLAFGLVATART